MNRTVLAVILICYFSNCCSYLLRENVLFFKTNQVSLTHDSWRIAMTLDLNPYDVFIQKVSDDSVEIDKLIRDTVQRYQGKTENPNFVLTFKNFICLHFLHSSQHDPVWPLCRINGSTV